MLEITIDDNTDMNQVRKMIRKYYIEHNITPTTKHKQTKTKKTYTDNGINDTDSIQKDIEHIGGKTYCNLNMFGFNDYWICKEDGCVYRRHNGELNQIKTNLWMSRQSISAALIVCMYNGEKYTTKQVKVLYATCFIPNPNKYRYVEVINGDYSNISINNLRWVEKKPRRVQ